MANLKKQSKRKFHTIYQTKNTVNDMIYIGAHSTDILDDGYLGSGFRLKLAIQKYGVDFFEKTILYLYDNPVQMFKKESELVNEEFLKRKDVYNIVAGGFGGYNKGTTGLKHLHHPETGKGCAVHPNVIPNMLNEGWKIGKAVSSTIGTLWVHKGDDKKMISPDALSTYLNLGWIRGLPKSPTSGKTWIFNPSLNKYSLCEKTELEEKILEGWIKQKWIPIKKGSIRVNNGIINRMVSEDELDNYLSNGWKKGQIRS